VDVSFTGAEIAIVTALLGSVCGVIGILFRNWKIEIDGRLKGEEEENAYLREQIEKTRTANQQELDRMRTYYQQELQRTREDAGKREERLMRIAANSTVLSAKAVDTLGEKGAS
jgi:hypothetical protein